MSVTLTPTAEKRVVDQLQGRSRGIGIRLGVKTTGCSGLSYVLEFADNIEDDDNVSEFDQFKVVIDSKSLVYLDGTKLDWVKRGLNEGFEFSNPNQSGECGCGESFTV